MSDVKVTTVTTPVVPIVRDFSQAGRPLTKHLNFTETFSDDIEFVSGRFQYKK